MDYLWMSIRARSAFIQLWGSPMNSWISMGNSPINRWFLRALWMIKPSIFQISSTAFWLRLVKSQLCVNKSSTSMVTLVFDRLFQISSRYLLDIHWYPLVNIQTTMEHHHAINGTLHYFNGVFSRATLVYQMVYSRHRNTFRVTQPSATPCHCATPQIRSSAHPEVAHGGHGGWTSAAKWRSF